LVNDSWKILNKPVATGVANAISDIFDLKFTFIPERSSNNRASASIATAWLTQRSQNVRELVRDEMHKREALYGEFVGECAKLLMDAFTHTLEKPETLLRAYALINRIRLCASPAVLNEAERLVVRITDQYFASNLAVEELRRVARSTEADQTSAENPLPKRSSNL
jgi:hypothetical protein